MIKIPGSKSPKALASRRVRKTAWLKKHLIREKDHNKGFSQEGERKTIKLLLAFSNTTNYNQYKHVIN